jgi:hypothetical protein
MRENAGPRAVLNAVERLSDGYGYSQRIAEEDLALAESQLHDYQARLGGAFQHAGYLKELETLRDQLRVGLSGEQKEGEPTVADIAGRIKELRAANTVEAAPARTSRGKASAETPVTSRILEKETENGEGEGWQQRVAGRTGWKRG